MTKKVISLLAKFDHVTSYFYLLVGSDAHLRVWSTTTGHLLCQENLTKTNNDIEYGFPPVLSFTDHWSNDNSLYGLLISHDRHRKFLPGL